MFLVNQKKKLRILNKLDMTNQWKGYVWLLRATDKSKGTKDKLADLSQEESGKSLNNYMGSVIKDYLDSEHNLKTLYDESSWEDIVPTKEKREVGIRLDKDLYNLLVAEVKAAGIKSVRRCMSYVLELHVKKDFLEIMPEVEMVQEEEVVEEVIQEEEEEIHENMPSLKGGPEEKPYIPEKKEKPVVVKEKTLFKCQVTYQYGEDGLQDGYSTETKFIYIEFGTEHSALRHLADYHNIEFKEVYKYINLLKFELKDVVKESMVKKLIKRADLEDFEDPGSEDDIFAIQPGDRRYDRRTQKEGRGTTKDENLIANWNRDQNKPDPNPVKPWDKPYL